GSDRRRRCPELRPCGIQGSRELRGRRLSDVQGGRADYHVLADSMALSRPSAPRLAPKLDRLYQDYNREDAASDPIQIVRRYANARDQEVIGFCAAALAFGRVQSVLNTVNGVAAVLGPSPAAYVRSFDPRAPHPELRAMVHRWIRGADIVALLWILRQM